MSKVIFVGMHNKVDTVPLCSSTKSGKLIDRIKKGLKNVPSLKTNLYDVDYYPSDNEKKSLAEDWIKRINPLDEDIIVLLGGEVHDNFIKPNKSSKVLKIAHPSSQWSNVNMDKYVMDTLFKIKNM